jgi:D-Tyr-tRNAtyr deacylase
MQANESNFTQASNMPQQHQKMLIFRVVEARGFSSGPQTTFEVSVKDKSSGILSLAQFAREKFAL